MITSLDLEPKRSWVVLLQETVDLTEAEGTMNLKTSSAPSRSCGNMSTAGSTPQPAVASGVQVVQSSSWSWRMMMGSPLLAVHSAEWIPDLQRRTPIAWKISIALLPFAVSGAKFEPTFLRLQSRCRNIYCNVKSWSFMTLKWQSMTFVSSFFRPPFVHVSGGADHCRRTTRFTCRSLDADPVAFTTKHARHKTIKHHSSTNSASTTWYHIGAYGTRNAACGISTWSWVKGEILRDPSQIMSNDWKSK